MVAATTDLCALSANQLLAGYACGEFSPVEVTRAVLDRIGTLDPQIHAFLKVDGEGAMQAARTAETAWHSAGEKPLLCGVPVSVKDTIEMAGMPTTYGSLAFRDNHCDDAEIVRRLRAAGAVILGKTNTPEFALAPRTENRLGAPTRNPWNLAHTAGGSSGGAAAAVAARMGPLAVGTDSAGSIRLPAAYQGLYGIKPTFQRIPSVQRWRASPARSHNGPITRTVRDAALMMAALGGPHPADPDASLHPHPDYMAFAAGNVRGARVAVSRTFGLKLNLDAIQLRMIEEASALLRDMGCTLVQADPPVPQGGDELEPGVWAYSGDHYAAAEAMIPDFWEKHQADLTDASRKIYGAGRTALAWKYRGILKRNRAFAEQMRQWFGDYDFLLAPCCGSAPKLDTTEVRDDRHGQFGLLAPFNLAYNPSAAIPFGIAEDGMPLAIQIVGRLGDDVGVLRISGLIEAAKPWSQRWPAITSPA